MFNYVNKAATASVRNNVRDAIFGRVIGDLILGLDMAADHIPPDDLGGTNEAIAAINAAVVDQVWQKIQAGVEGGRLANHDCERCNRAAGNGSCRLPLLLPARHPSRRNPSTTWTTIFRFEPKRRWLREKLFSHP
jgi:hypothetical protein